MENRQYQINMHFICKPEKSSLFVCVELTADFSSFSFTSDDSEQPGERGLSDYVADKATAPI